MTELKEHNGVLITGHILIRDKETDEILLNKSESSMVNDNIKKGNIENE